MRLDNTLRQSVLLTNVETGNTLEFSSMTDAGIFLGISRVTVSKYLLNNQSYRGYTFYKDLQKDKDTSLSEPLFLPKVVNQQPVRLTNELKKVSKDFSSMTEAAEYLEISRAAL